MSYFRIGEFEPTPYQDLDPETRRVVDELHWSNPYLSYAEALETASRRISENAADELRRKMEAGA